MNTGQEQLPAEATPLLAALRAFAHAHVAPLSAGPGTAHSWAGPTIRAACAQGLAGIEIPKALGGLGLPYPVRAAAVEALVH